MSKILEKEKLAEDTYVMKIHAPEIASKAKPGQFIVLRVNEESERIPLTIADFDKESVTIVFLVVGYSTDELSKLEVNDEILDVLGPLGHPSEIEKLGTVVLIGGGLGIAPIYPQARAFKEAGNKVIVIIGGRNKERLFWEDKLKEVSDELVVCTDDGSYGIKGVVTEPLKKYLDKADLVIAIGPIIMMKFVAMTTKGKVKTIVSLNPIMIDGMGMCGGCRVTVGGQVKFACCDGPEFDASLIDFDELMKRNKIYEKEEKECKCCEKVSN